MSRRIRKVTREDFEILLEFAREIHTQKNEPIPSLNYENWYKVETALQQPFNYFFGVVQYRGFLKKASILFYELAKGHCLSNGNKRMACVTLDSFCTINYRRLVISNNDLVELARHTASSDPMEMDDCLVHIQDVLRVSIVHEV